MIFCSTTVEEILHQLIGSLSQYWQDFIHPRWCRISSIKCSFYYQTMAVSIEMIEPYPTVALPANRPLNNPTSPPKKYILSPSKILVVPVSGIFVDEWFKNLQCSSDESICRKDQTTSNITSPRYPNTCWESIWTPQICKKTPNPRSSLGCLDKEVISKKHPTTFPGSKQLFQI